MDKYEYQVCADQIKLLISEKRFAEAMAIADTIDWRRVKSVSMLCTVSEIYKINKCYAESMEILLLAYDRYPNGRTIVYALCELAIKLNDIVRAVEYYKEFVQLAPEDTSNYVLLYKIYELQEVSLEERIEVLEEFKKRDYREKWAYELALLYHKIGQETRCIQECDELILWFGDGKFVKKAMELKMQHTGLSREQQLKYEGRQEPMTDQFMSMQQPVQQLYDTDPQAGNPQQIPINPYMQQSPMNGMGYMNQNVMQQMPYQTQGEMYQPQMAPQQAPDMGPMSVQPAPNQPIGKTAQMLSTSEIDSIEVRPVNVGMYNTMDLQNGLSENIKKFFEKEQSETEDKNVTYSSDPQAYNKLYENNTFDMNSEPVFRTDAIETEENEQDDVDEDLQVTQCMPSREDIKETAGAVSKTEDTLEDEDEEAYREAIYKEDTEEKTNIEEKNIDIKEEATPIPENINKGYSDNSQLMRMKDDTVNKLEEELIRAHDAASINSGSKPNLDVTPSKRIGEKYNEMLMQEYDGQISMSIEKKEPVEKQITGQMDFDDLYISWEEKRRENEQRRIQEAKKKSLIQTSDIMAQLKGVLPEIDDIAKPTPPKALPPIDFAAIPHARPVIKTPVYDIEEEEDVKQSSVVNMPETSSRITASIPEILPSALNDKEDKLTDDDIDRAVEAAISKHDVNPVSYIKDSNEVEDNAVTESELNAKPDTVGVPEEIIKEEAVEESQETIEAFEAKEPEEPIEEVAVEESQATIEAFEAKEPEEPIEEEAVEEPQEATEAFEAKEPEEPIEEEAVEEPQETIETFEANEPEDPIEEVAKDEPQEVAEPEEAIESEEDAPIVETVASSVVITSAIREDDSDNKDILEAVTEEIPIDEIKAALDEEIKEATQVIEDLADEPADVEGEDDEEELPVIQFDFEPYKENEEDNKPDVSDDEESNEMELRYSVDDEAAKKASMEVTSELPRYPYEEIDDYGEVDEIETIEQPEDVDNLSNTTDIPVDEVAKANYEAGIEDDYEKLDDDEDEKKHPSYMKITRTPTSRRDFDKEELRIFGRFDGIEWIKSQIVNAIDEMCMDPAKGNVIIVGPDAISRRSLAVDVVKAMQALDSDFKGKVAKISGEALNKKDIPLTIKKLHHGALIVENAGGLTPASCKVLAEALELESNPILVVLEGDEDSIQNLIVSSKGLVERVFSARIELQEYTTDDLVAYGKSYANEQEYSIDEMGVLALYTKIGRLQTLEHSATLEEVREIIDSAIKHVDKKNMSHFVDVLLAKRYDDEDYIILREKDFIL